MFKRQISQALRSEIQTEKFKAIYEEVRKSNPAISGFLNPEELLRFMHDKTVQDRDTKDEVLKTLLREFQNDQTRLLGPYILLLMLPALSRLYFEYLRKLSNHPWLESEELESVIWSACLVAIKNPDVLARSHRIAAAIKDRVKNAIRKWFRSIKRTEKEAPLEEAENLSYAERSESPCDLESMIRRFVAQGVLTSTEAHLIISTRIYGQKLRRIVGRFGGSSYAALQRRKHRAESKLRAHLEGLIKNDV